VPHRHVQLNGSRLISTKRGTRTGSAARIVLQADAAGNNNSLTETNSINVTARAGWRRIPISTAIQ
jgi:hypothetical protein